MRALVVAVLLVACSEPPGITLEVMRSHVRDRVTTVELFVGQHCDGCPRRMAPINQDGTQMLPRTTDMWMVNDPAVFEGLWDGDAAQFRLTSSQDGDEDVPIIVAVGFDAAHHATSTVMLPAVTVPIDHGEHWRAYLEEAKPIVDPYPQDVERIAIWPPQRRGPQCVTLEHPQFTGDTFVPFDDTDCDGVAAPECAPFTPNAHQVAPTIENTDCIITAASTGPTPLCLLGGTPCDEGASPPPPGTSCESHQVDYCISDAFCTSCALINGSYGTYDTCFQGRLANFTAGGPFIHCAIPMEMTGDACANADQNEGDIDFTPLLASGDGATTCRDLDLSNVALPLAFDSDVEIGTDMKVTISSPSDPCTATLRWSGTAPLEAMSFSRAVLADLDLDNGKHMVVPVLLEGVLDCNKKLSCDVPLIMNPADSLLSCAKPTKDSTVCFGSTPCLGGAVCGSHCCNKGESCRDGVCVCGDGPHCVGPACIDPNAPDPTTTGCGIVCCGTPGAPPCG